MFKKTTVFLLFCLTLTSPWFTTGICAPPPGYHGGSGSFQGGGRPGGPPPPYHGGHAPGPSRYYGGYPGYHYDDAWLWGLGGIIFGSVLTAAFLQYPPPPQVVYTAPPPPTRIYTYKPPVPPGLCRWERTVLDAYGRAVLDQYGNPVKEYTIGSCQTPPPN